MSGQESRLSCGFPIVFDMSQALKQNSIQRFLIFAWSLLFLFLFMGTATAEDRIAVVFRLDLALHEKLVEEVREIFAQEFPEAKIIPWPVSIDQGRETHNQFKKQRPERIVALGDLALNYSLTATPGLPGVYLLVNSQTLAEQAAATGNWNGTRLWVTPETQMEIISSVLPNVRKVGVIVTSASQVNLDALEKAARQHNIRLHIVRVKNRRKIMSELDRLYQNNDAILLEPDPNLLNEIVLGEMLKLQHRYRRPLITLSKRFVTLGAMMSISYSFSKRVKKSVGIFIAETKGDLERKQDLTSLCCLQVGVNSNVADRIGTTVSEAVFQNIDFISTGDGRADESN